MTFIGTKANSITNYTNYIAQVYGNMKIYLKICYLGCDNAAELQYGFFISISIVHVMQ